MSSMSYCQFENLNKAFYECIDDFEKESSQSEAKAKVRIAQKMATLFRDFGVDVDETQLQNFITHLRENTDDN